MIVKKEKALLLVFFILSLYVTSLSAGYSCTYTCSTNPLEQIYPNQNMCILLDEIPDSLQNIPFGMYPNCDIYNTNRFSYNKRFNWFPHAIFTPTTPQEVQDVLQQAIEHHLPFFIRSGGHCYEPILFAGYIIDLRNFSDIIPDTNTDTVYIGAGCKLGEVIIALAALDYAIPTGTCPSVGVSGLALGGGIGFLIRNYGLTCDSIIDMTVITADNQLITVSATNHPDLFWALRGAGANAFGIVLGYTFRMYHIPTVSLLQLRWDWDPQIFSAVYNEWQSWVMTLPQTISAETVFKYKDGKARLSVNALKVGAEPFTEWESAFKKFNPTSATVYTGNYLGAAELAASNYPMPFSKTKSKMLFKPLPQAGINALINWMRILQDNQCVYEAFFGIGAGIPGALALTETAYFPRNAYGWMFGFIYWPHQTQETAALNLIQQVYKELEPHTSPYSYSNLVDYDLGADYLHAYYGDHVARLIHIKNVYDPHNIFTWPQGIPLAYVPKSVLTQYIQNKYCSGN